MTYQSFDEWQKNPIQGAIPFPPSIEAAINERCPCMSKPLAECDCEPAENPELAEVAESLALHSTREAMQHLEDQPDEE